MGPGGGQSVKNARGHRGGVGCGVQPRRQTSHRRAPTGLCALREDGKPKGRPMRGHTDGVRAVAFSPDGKTVATGSDDRTVRLWEGARARPRGSPWQAIPTGSPGSRSAQMERRSRQRALTASAPLGPGDRCAQRNALKGHTDNVADLAFSPDGKLLATPALIARSDCGTAAANHWGPSPAIAARSGTWHSAQTRRGWHRQARTDGQDLEPHSRRLGGRRLQDRQRNLWRIEWDRYIGSDIAYERTCSNFPAGKGAQKDAPVARY